MTLSVRHAPRKRRSRRKGTSWYPDRILQAAAKVFALKTYAGASMDDVAESAATTKSVLYYYFESKAALLSALYDQGLDESLALLEEILSSNETPLQHLRRALWVHTKTMCEDRWRRKVLARGADPRSFDDAMRRSVLARRRKYQSLIQGLFQEAAEAGFIRSDLDLGVVSKIAVGGLNKVSDWYNARGRLSAREIADIAVEYVLSGLVRDITPTDTLVAETQTDAGTDRASGT